MLQDENHFAKLELYLKNLLITLPLLFIIFICIYSATQYLIFDPRSLSFVSESVKIYDKNDNFLWEISRDNAVRNTPVSISKIPEVCKNAIVSIEDKTFYENVGVDLNGVARLVISSLTSGSSGGGSTISQQVLKNSLGRIYNRNPLDKLNEIIYSLRLNQVLSKDEILELYLNNIYFGGLNYGVESASQDYFGKSVSDLNLAECSYLMGIPQWPGVFNPYGDSEQGVDRQKEVLDSMLKNNYITESAENEALQFPLDFKLNEAEIHAPHFIQYLQDKYNILKENSGSQLPFTNLQDVKTLAGMKITTYYDYELHKKILELIKTNVEKFKEQKVNNAAVIVLDKQGHLITMLGSIDYFNEEIAGKFNSTLGFRQPGSALIPIIYSIGFVNNLPLTLYPNYPFNLDVQKNEKTENVLIKNNDNSESLTVSLTDTLKNNLTIPTIRFIQSYSPVNLMWRFEDFGIKRPEGQNWCNEIMIMEGCEINLLTLTLSYNVINSGIPYSDNELKRITDKDNTNIDFKENDMITNFDETLLNGAKLVENILKNKEEDDWFIQNGDTRNLKDTFAIGFNDNYTVGVWVGNTQGEAMDNIKSESVAVPIFKQIINELK